MHPRQMANADSRRAARAIVATTAQVAPDWPNPYQSTTAAVDRVAPMAWANRLGGPATGFGGQGSRGATSRVATRPSGLSLGPASTRAQNP